MADSVDTRNESKDGVTPVVEKIEHFDVQLDDVVRDIPVPEKKDVHSKTQSTMAYAFVGLLAAVLLIGIVASIIALNFVKFDAELFKYVFDKSVTGLSPIVGAIVGFYYGAKK